MNYFVSRNGQEYGPYTLGDLQRYVASGEILLTDAARSEGMSESLPVSRIIGNIPVPAPATSVVPVANTVYYPDPPNLHWGLVLLFGVLSCGIFSIVWDLVQSAWMKKLAPQSKAIYYYIGAAGVLALTAVANFSLAFTHHAPGGNPYAVLNLVYVILLLIGRFSLRSSLENHFSSVEPFGLTLSGIMTFFFGGVYFQYHLSDIVRRKHAMPASLISA